MDGYNHLYYMMADRGKIDAFNQRLRDFAPTYQEITEMFRRAVCAEFTAQDEFSFAVKIVQCPEQGCRRMVTHRAIPNWSTMRLNGVTVYWPGPRSQIAAVCDVVEYEQMLNEIPLFLDEVMNRPEWLSLVEEADDPRPYISFEVDENGIIHVHSIGPLSDPRFIPPSSMHHLFNGAH